jgi:thiamine biosynthesis lipoprotein
MTSEVKFSSKGALGRPFLALVAAIVVGCSSESEFVVQGEAQGSTFVVRAYGDSLEFAESDVARWLADYNRAASAWDSNSELSRVNRGDTLQPSLLLNDLLNVTEGIRQATDSLVDPALEPILQAWGFTAGTQMLPSDQGPTRDSAIVDSLMAFVVWSPPVHGANGTYLPHPINVNAFAQGHSVDIVLDSLRARGASAAFVEIGGEVRTYGTKPDGSAFKVGIEKPLTSGDRSLQLTVELEDRALATSGNYRKFQVDSATGRSFGHSLDPRTGWPAPTDVLSATLIGPSCAEADAYATMAMVLGVDRTMQWLAEHPEWDAILIFSDAQGALQIYNSLK